MGFLESDDSSRGKAGPSRVLSDRENPHAIWCFTWPDPADLGGNMG
jgi:hypothetical protein